MANGVTYAPGSFKAGDNLQQNDESALSKLIQDRNLQQFLAQLGAEISGEEGVGAMVGKPTSQLIQRQALSEALAKNSNVTLGADGSMKIQQQTGGQGQTQDQSQGAITNQQGGPGGATIQQEGAGYDIPSSEDSYSVFDRIADSIIGE